RTDVLCTRSRRWRQVAGRDVLARPRVTTRRLAHVSPECGAERARRRVAHTLRDLADSNILAAEQIPRDRQAPAERILARREADGAGAPLEERRPRKRRSSCELGHLPRTSKLTVHVSYRWREPRIGQRTPESRGRVFIRSRSSRFDQQDFHEPREHEIAP